MFETTETTKISAAMPHARLFQKNIMRALLGAVLLLVVSVSLCWADDQAKRLLSLIDYIGGDYQNAVQAGQVINRDEYQEMSEFAARSVELFNQLKAKENGDKANIENDLRTLATHIKNMSGEEVVPQLAQQIKDRLIKTYSIITSPKATPAYDGAKAIYQANCTQCHGTSGRGDGPAATSMQPREPQPANFTDPELINNLSPFKAFNTTTFGIQGTGMPSFSGFSEEQRWEAAFYIFSLRFSAEDAARGRELFAARELSPELIKPATLATSSDGELTKKLTAALGSEQEALTVLAYLRYGLLQDRKADPLLTARTFLREAVELYQSGDQKVAYQRSVDAYLDGFELAEPALFAKNAAMGRDLEALFTEFRGLIRNGADVGRIRDVYEKLDGGLLQAMEVLGGQPGESGSFTFFNAALIIIREGLEAALIIAAIIAVLKSMRATHTIRYVHWGWILALHSGIVTWFLAQTVITFSGAQRELVEGFTSLLAALVLFSVSYWLISKAEAKRWHRFIQARVEEALSGRRVFALVGVSFLAVYREAFETVLFYQALWLQSQGTQVLVIWGFIGGTILLAALVWGIFKLGMKIPLRLFFGASSALLYVLAFVFTGEGVKDLQAVGWVRETPLAWAPQITILGIYPTLETLLAQSILLLALVVALFWLWRATQTAETYGNA
ncbi:MAG TPA: cytochrome c/FTR1 family iron permease [Candidatus Binatia bacterium]|nr:cytochrome c/FTR1 family iron permease [Candidatus Binatia bacterium]